MTSRNNRLTQSSHHLFSFGVLLALLVGGTLFAQDKAADEDVAKGIPPTAITADKMDYDMMNRVAVLVGNVKVIDEELTLQANTMTVHFSAKNEIIKIDAQGKVKITRDGAVATSGKAVFDVPAGKVVLMETPVLIQGTNRITGAEVITYLRKEERFQFSGGQPKIEYYRPPDQDAGLDLMKDDQDDGAKD